MLLFIYFIFSLQGFDITDFGYHLTNQYLLLKYPLSKIYFNPMYILSDFVGGVWLHVISDPNFLWSKLGGAILLSFCALFVYLILKNYFSKSDVFLYVLICSLFLTMYTGSLINYYTFPAFLTIIFLWIFNKLLLVSKDSKEFRIYAFILGFLFIPICLSRLPLILLIIILPVVGLYYWITKSHIHGLVRGLKFAVLGFIFSTLLFLLIFYELNILEEYLHLLSSQLFQSASGDIQTISTKYSLIALMSLYIDSYIGVFKGVLLFAGGIFFLKRLKIIINQKWINVLLVLVLIIVLISIAYFSLFTFVALNLLSIFIGIILLFVGIFFYVDKGISRNLSLLLLVSAGLMIINPIGSNTGIYKSSYAFWLILPLSLLCIKDLGKRTENAFIKYLSSFIPILLILMLILAIFFFFIGVNVYRDDPNRLYLTSSFQSSPLIGIYSGADRVKVTDELISVIQNETAPGDYLLMSNLPMFYYLTQTRPALKNPWLSSIPKESIVALEEEREQRGEIQPKLFIYSKFNSRDRYWAYSTTIEDEEENEKLNYLKERFIGKLNYTHIWENEAFVIYKEPISLNY